MADQVVVQPESLLNLDDLLQCPVCYEIPLGQIFQCNEGHHVCGRCKARLDVCPVCRALFFGTRNYAMEELIANFKKLKTFKADGKAATGSGSSESSTTACETVSGETESDAGENNSNRSNITRVPQACKGLFRCLCCKIVKAERLPAARLLNHLRYFHSPDLIEGQSENGEYVQAWEFSTRPGRIVTAVRVSEMGIYFLVIDIDVNHIHAWLTMAASPSVANAFSYTLTLSGNDREAIFTDCVLSVRSCEGTLKKRGHALVVTGMNAMALTSSTSISAKLCLRRTPADQLAHQTQPRAVMRVATRGNYRDGTSHEFSAIFNAHSRERGNIIEDLFNETASLHSRLAALEEVGSEEDNDYALRLVRAFTAMRMANRAAEASRVDRAHSERDSAPSVPPTAQPLSRNARRRMRQRLRTALNDDTPARPASQPRPRPRSQTGRVRVDTIQQASSPHSAQANLTNGPSTSAANVQNANQARNKKKRRHRR